MDISEIIKDCVFGEAYCRTLYDTIRLHFINRSDVPSGLEIGFDSGSSALMFLSALPNSKLISVDVRADLDPALDLIRKYGFSGRHELYVADSGKVLNTLIQEDESFDYIYIDGDHLYKPAKRDIYLGFMLLKPGGLFIIDDCVKDHPVFGVYQAVEEFLADHPELEKVVIEGNPHIAIIIRKK